MGLAESGGINTWGVFPSTTRQQFIDGATYFLLAAGWELSAEVYASKTHTYSSIVTGTSITIDGNTYVWRTVINNAVPWEVLLGGTINESLSNLVSAIRRLPDDEGILYSTATPSPLTTITPSVDGNDFIVTAWVAGPAGSGINTSNGATAGGGYRLQAKGPQFQASEPGTQLSCYLYLYDEGATATGHDLVSVVMKGVAYPDASTRVHYIEVDDGFEHRIVCNRCQFFIYRQGVRSSGFGSVLCGGIPWLPVSTACDDEVPAARADELFWISSDKQGAGGPEMTPRTSVVGMQCFHSVDIPASKTGTVGSESRWDNTDGVFNGVRTGEVAIGTPLGQGQPRMLSLTPSSNYLLSGSALFHQTALVNTMYWHDEQPMLLEPMFGWGDTGADDLLTRCQFYDAWIQTRQYIPVADTVRENITNRLLQPFEMYGQTGYWLPFTYDCKFGTLVLLVPTPEPAEIQPEDGNYCY